MVLFAAHDLLAQADVSPKPRVFILYPQLLAKSRQRIAAGEQEAVDFDRARPLLFVA